MWDDEHAGSEPDWPSRAGVSLQFHALGQLATRNTGLGRATGSTDSMPVARPGSDHLCARLIQHVVRAVAQQSLCAAVPPYDALPVVHHKQGLCAIAKRPEPPRVISRPGLLMSPPRAKPGAATSVSHTKARPVVRQTQSGDVRAFTSCQRGHQNMRFLTVDSKRRAGRHRPRASRQRDHDRTGAKHQHQRREVLRVEIGEA